MHPPISVNSRIEYELRARIVELEAELAGNKQHIDAYFGIAHELGMSQTSSRPPSAFIRDKLAEAQRYAERWRMLPAFLEKYQIEYVGLLSDIDAALARKEGE